MDIHCHMKRDISLEKAHEIAHVVENTIKGNIPGVKDVTIHIEPAP